MNWPGLTKICFKWFEDTSWLWYHGVSFIMVAAELLQTKWWLIESCHNDGSMYGPLDHWSLFNDGVYGPPPPKRKNNGWCPSYYWKVHWPKKMCLASSSFRTRFFSHKVSPWRFFTSQILRYRFAMPMTIHINRCPRKTSRGEAVGFSRARKFQSRRIWCQNSCNMILFCQREIWMQSSIKDVRLFWDHVWTLAAPTSFIHV